MEDLLTSFGPNVYVLPFFLFLLMPLSPPLQLLGSLLLSFQKQGFPLRHLPLAMHVLLEITRHFRSLPRDSCGRRGSVCFHEPTLKKNPIPPLAPSSFCSSGFVHASGGPVSSPLDSLCCSEERFTVSAARCSCSTGSKGSEAAT